MPKKNWVGIAFLLFLLLSVAVTLTFFFQVQVSQKRAAEGPLTISLNSVPKEPTERIWGNFSQGGEEKELMLTSAQNEIKKLRPEFIRIDHLFDFYPVIKRGTDGKLNFDFSFLDSRVEEIVRLGATPFLSLSYFPSAISANPVAAPISYQDWQVLIEKTIQRYSGKNEKNIPGIYYEVWNEPDLFGNMTPQNYFSLYRATVTASQNCQNCQNFKIGGPAITTLKKNWLVDFLTLVDQNRLRLDFFSWHSYQINPFKTRQEVEIAKELLAGRSLPPEIIISEWGSLPQISPLHDSFFDAAHAVSTVAVLRGLPVRLFAFELKDGPSPDGKKYWGRWGLLTHQSQGLTPKPRYYSFLYLDKLLSHRIETLSASPGTAVIGSTDKKESYSIVIAKISNELTPITCKINNLPPGIYSTNLYTLGPTNSPLVSSADQISFNGGGFNFNLPPTGNAVFLLETNRTSPALIKALGRSSGANDFSAKLTSFVPPLTFTLNPTGEKSNVNSISVDFWFKPNWSGANSQTHILAESKDKNSDGFRLWVEKQGFSLVLRLAALANDQPLEGIQSSLSSWELSSWHQLSLAVNNQKMVISLNVDQQGITSPFPTGQTIKFGNSLTIGGGGTIQTNSAEGSIDDLKITLNDQAYYQSDFN